MKELTFLEQTGNTHLQPYIKSEGKEELVEGYEREREMALMPEGPTAPKSCSNATLD